MHGNVKIRPIDVKTLKSMNTNYPLLTADFDEKFLRALLSAIFTKMELKECAIKSSLLALNPDRLKFAKGILIGFDIVWY